MAKLSVFNFTTLNGFFSGPGGDFSWHVHGAEEAAYSGESMKSESTLLFGRVTYQIMAAAWPTPQGAERDPATASGMNRAEKVVFSRTLKSIDWANTRIVADNIEDEVRRMKAESTVDLTILGSGSIVTQLTDAGLIDEYQVMIDPVVLGEGTPMFKGLGRKVNLELVASRIFGSGTVLLTYRPRGR